MVADKAFSYAVRASYALFTAIDTYVKPGGIHRLMPGDTYRLYAFLGSIVMRELAASFEQGASISTGRIRSDEFGVGDLLFRATRSFYEVTESRPPIGILLTYILYSGAMGMATSRAPSGNIVANANNFYNLITHASTPSDAEKVIKIIKSFGTIREIKVLEEQGLTPSRVITMGYNVADILEYFNNISPCYVSPRRVQQAYNHAQEITDTYKNTRDMNYSVVSLYLKLLKEYKPSYSSEIDKCVKNGALLSGKSIKCLLELDYVLKKQSSVHEYLVDLSLYLALPVLMSMYISIS